MSQIFYHHFSQVEAYDYSEGFVEMMRSEESRRELTNLTCYQGDSHVQQSYSQNKFDLILGCNLIDRLHTPSLWIKQSKVVTDLLIRLQSSK